MFHLLWIFQITTKMEFRTQNNRENHHRMWLAALLTVLILPVFINSKSIGFTDVNSLDVQVSYFKRFGYLHNNFDLSNLKAGLSKETGQLFERAVRDFQDMMGLPITGILDEESLRVMSMPRCGLPDKEIYQYFEKTRQKRYATFNDLRLKSNNISYGIEPSSHTNDLSRQQINDILRRSFKMYSDNANLHFYEDRQPFVEFRFARYDHDDDFNFDGPGGILAHAFPPIYSNLYTPNLGDIHLDDDENWTDRSVEGRNLHQVIVHELGHSLGLNHSNVKDAVMAPVYHGYNPDFHLHQDDIDGIQYLYGRPIDKPAPPPAQQPPPEENIPQQRPPPRQPPQQQTPRPWRPTQQPWEPTPRPTPQPTQAPTPRPQSRGYCVINYCDCPKVDAITAIPELDVFFAFNGRYVYKINTYGYVFPGYPKLIDLVFPKFQGTLDAALAWPKSIYRNAPNDRVFLFNDIWVYTYFVHSNKSITFHDLGRIQDRFKGARGPVDVALVWSGNQVTYFISGHQYYRLSTNGDGNIHDNYPTSISAWGFPNNQVPDAGLQFFNRRTYFFFGSDYYKYDDDNIQVIGSPYPRPIGRWWFGCTGLNLVDEGYSNRWQHEPQNELEDDAKGRLLLSELKSNIGSIVSFSLMNLILGTMFLLSISLNV